MRRRPFLAIEQLHPDNGSQFSNEDSIRYFVEVGTGTQRSGNHPFHK